MRSLIYASGVSLVLSLLLSACSGGGGDSSSGTPTASTVTGQFIDAPVQGLGYLCSSGKRDKTNSNGEYVCNVGDNVTFFIGSVEIGTAVAQTNAITPYTLFPNNNTATINLARLLQSLDTDTTDATITINTALETKIPTDTNFTAQDFETTVQTALAITLVSAEEAQTSMNEAIVSVGGTIPEPTPVENNGLATPPTPPTL